MTTLRALLGLLALLAGGAAAAWQGPAARSVSPAAPGQPASLHGRTLSGPLRPGMPAWDEGWGVVISGPCEGEDPDLDFLGDCDTCPHVPDPSNADRDRDGVGDACDACPDVAGARRDGCEADGGEPAALRQSPRLHARE